MKITAAQLEELKQRYTDACANYDNIRRISDEAHTVWRSAEYEKVSAQGATAAAEDKFKRAAAHFLESHDLANTVLKDIGLPLNSEPDEPGPGWA